MIFLVTAECRLKEQYNSYIQFIFMKHLAASARDQGSFKWDIVQVSKGTVKSPPTTLCSLSASYSFRPRWLLRVHWRLKSNERDVMWEYQLRNEFDVSSSAQHGMVFSSCTRAAAGLVLCWVLGREKEPCEGARRALVGNLFTHRAGCFWSTEEWAGSPKIHRIPQECW